MADFPPGSRAIKIPLQSKAPSIPAAAQRRRRTGRNGKSVSTAESSESTGSSYVSSEAESSWASQPHTPAAYQGQRSIDTSSGSDSTGSQPESKRKDKQKAEDDTPAASPPSLMFASSSPLGPSMLSSSSYKSINLNAHHDDPDEPPRLITYTQHSQGFIWNAELFLPSYLLHRYAGRRGGRRKQYDADFGDEEEACQVAEIFVTDEEAEAMML